MSEVQQNRYSRQLSLSNMDEAKQEKLLASKAVVLAGSDSSFYAVRQLVESGVGQIKVLKSVLKPDYFGEEEIKKISALNPDVNLSFERLDSLEKIEPILSSCDVIIESLLDWQLKLSLSDYAMRANVPLIHSGVVGHRYQIYTMVPGKSACLRCVFPAAGIEDFPLGVLKEHPLRAVEAMAGSLMALDATKILCDLGVMQSRCLWRFDCLSGDFEAVRNLTMSHDCPDCGPRRY